MLVDVQHPGSVALTARVEKSVQDGFWAVLKRRWSMRGVRRFDPSPSLAAQIGRAPILLVAGDLSPEGGPLHESLMLWVGRILTLQPETRIAAVNVIRTAVLGIDSGTDASGQSLHVSRLVALKAWAGGLDLSEAQLTFAVLESTDPAQSLIDHAEALHASHVLMNARGHSTAWRDLGAVSSKVVAQTPCSVTVIRLAGAAPEPEAAA